MPPPSPFFIVIIGAAAGLFYYAAFYYFRRKRLIENTPTSKVRSLAMGLVEVFGKAQMFKKLKKSPISKKDCVYYTLEVQEYVKSGKQGHWKTIKFETSNNDFYVQDETGKVLVNPKEVMLEIKPSYQNQKGFVIKQSKEALAYLENAKLFKKNSFGLMPQLKIIEKAILKNQELYVIGRAEKNPYPNKEITNESNLMIKMGNENVFIISDKKENDIVKGYLKRLIGFLIAAIICSTIAFIILIKIIKAW